MRRSHWYAKWDVVEICKTLDLMSSSGLQYMRYKATWGESSIRQLGANNSSRQHTVRRKAQWDNMGQKLNRTTWGKSLIGRHGAKSLIGRHGAKPYCRKSRHRRIKKQHRYERLAATSPLILHYMGNSLTHSHKTPPKNPQNFVPRCICPWSQDSSKHASACFVLVSWEGRSFARQQQHQQ